MTSIRRKLSSQSGISILYALAFFLVASMVTVVILDASVTATKRVKAQQLSQQANLTLVSGGKLLQKMLEETSVTITRPVLVDDEGNPILGEHGETLYGQEEFAGEGPLGDALKSAVQSVRFNPTLPYQSEDENKLITVNVSGSDVEDAFSDVTMSFTMYWQRVDDRYFEILCDITAEGTENHLMISAWWATPESLDNNPGPVTVRWTVDLKGGAEYAKEAAQPGG